MSTPFKMKGNPMQRNFGIGSPLHKDEKEAEGKTASGGTTWAGKLTAAKDALGARHFVQSYIQNKKDIREGTYKGYLKSEPTKKKKQKKELVPKYKEIKEKIIKNKK